MICYVLIVIEAAAFVVIGIAVRDAEYSYRRLMNKVRRVETMLCRNECERIMNDTTIWHGISRV